MRNDFHNIPDGATVRLYPNEQNLLHYKPHEVMLRGGFFFSKGTPEDGPDYYMGDVALYNIGYTYPSYERKR